MIDSTCHKNFSSSGQTKVWKLLLALYLQLL
jgi:hypothetical protein